MKDRSQYGRRCLLTAMSLSCATLASLSTFAVAAAKPEAQQGPRSYSESSYLLDRPSRSINRPPPVSFHNRGALQVYNNRVDFDAAVGGGAVFANENFDGGATPPGVVNTCTEPVNSASNDVCFSPGNLVGGFQVTSSSGTGVVILGSAFLGAGQTTPVVGANTFADTTIITFTTNVTAFSADFYGGFNVDVVTVTVLDEFSNVLGSGVATPTAVDAPAFLGAISPTPIGSIIIESANGGGELVDNLQFGTTGGGGSLAVQSLSAVVADACSSDPGQSNGIVEPGETVSITVPVEAIGGDFNNVVAELDQPAPPGVTYLTSSANLGTITSGNSANASFSILVNPGFMCLSDFALGITANADEGSGIGSVMLDVGAPGSPVPGDVPLPIPDNNPAGASSVINVASNFVLSDLSVRVDIEHTFVGDLIITLQSPLGTTITLLDRPGVPASTFGCANNNIDATFVDGGADPESTCDGAGTAAPWPVTVAGPVQPLSTFNGENVQGNWTLTVSDNVGIDTGQIIDWELIPTPAFEDICSVCGDDFIFRNGFELMPL